MPDKNDMHLITYLALRENDALVCINGDTRKVKEFLTDEAFVEKHLNYSIEDIKVVDVIEVVENDKIDGAAIIARIQDYCDKIMKQRGLKLNDNE